MATFVSTFADSAVGSAPAGWTHQWNATGFTVAGDPTALGGKYLSCPATSGQKFLSFDAAGTPTDVEIMTRVRIGATNVGRFWMGVRGDPTIDCINAGIYNGYNSALIARLINGGGGLVSGGSSTTINMPINEWFRQRMRVTGNQVMYRVWRETEAEPTGWTIGPLTDNAMPQVAGWVGIMLDGGAPSTRDVDWMTVGTNGDAAPEPTITTEVRNIKADRILSNNAPVDKVYLGDTLVWGLGSGGGGGSTEPIPTKIWHYEAGTLSPPWSEIHVLRSDQWAVTTDNPYPGTTRSAEFNVKPGDTGWGGTSGTLRSEVRSTIPEIGSPTNGTDQWWAWPTYFRPDFNWDENNQFLIFTQWHHTNNGGNPNIHFWSDVNENLMLDIRGGSGGSVSGDAQYVKTYNLGTIVKGAWNDFLVHIIWSDSPSQGRVEVWHNGTQVHAANDATLYSGQSVYIKQGIYSAAGTQLQHFIKHGPLRYGSTRQSVETLPTL